MFDSLASLDSVLLSNTYNVALTMVSRNAKTGPIPVSTTTRATCPNACPFRKDSEGGCYAEGGPLAMFWQKVTEGAAGTTWELFIDQIGAMPAGTLWRHNQAGDLPGDGVRIDSHALAQLVRANKKRNKRGFTYSHYNVTNIVENREAIANANANGFTINLSANNMTQADSLAALNVAPVVAVLPVSYERANVKGEWTESLSDYRERTRDVFTPEGRRVVVCPATYRDDVTCASCGLCARLRDSIVGFPAHGASKRKANAVAVS